MQKTFFEKIRTIFKYLEIEKRNHLFFFAQKVKSKDKSFYLYKNL